MSGIRQCAHVTLCVCILLVELTVFRKNVIEQKLRTPNAHTVQLPPFKYILRTSAASGPLPFPSQSAPTTFPRFVVLINVLVCVINNFFFLSKYVLCTHRRTACIHILNERCIIEEEDNKVTGVFRNPLKPVSNAHEAYTCVVYITFYDSKFLLQRCPISISRFESENIHIRRGRRGHSVRIGHYNASVIALSF